MTYSKPEITKVASSIEAIQSRGAKVLVSVLEGPARYREVTPNAYEADE